MDHHKFLDIACSEANKAQENGDKAAGAVLVKSGEVVARSHDRCKQKNDPVALADLDCIRRAGRRSDQNSLTFYITDYPSMLSAGTILQFSIGQLVIGLPRTDSPAISLLQEKKVPINFIPHQDCVSLQHG